MSSLVLNLFGETVQRKRRRRRAVPKTSLRTVTLIEPQGVPDGFFPRLPVKVLKLKDKSLKAERWPNELRFDGAPFGKSKLVWRRAGKWTAEEPPFDCIEAKVTVLTFTEEKRS